MAETEPLPQPENDENDPFERSHHPRETNEDEYQQHLLRLEQLSERADVLEILTKTNSVWNAHNAKQKAADAVTWQKNIAEFHAILAQEITCIIRPNTTIAGVLEQWRALLCPSDIPFFDDLQSILEDDTIEPGQQSRSMKKALYHLLRSALGPEENITLKKIDTHLRKYLRQALKERERQN